jgi:hypothetical protein
MTRYTVALNGPTLSCYDGCAHDVFDAIAECAKINATPPGSYRASVRGAGRVAAGVLTIHEDRRITNGPRWNRPTPAEPIPDSGDLPVEVFDV